MVYTLHLKGRDCQAGSQKKTQLYAMYKKFTLNIKVYIGQKRKHGTDKPWKY